MDKDLRKLARRVAIGNTDALDILVHKLMGRGFDPFLGSCEPPIIKAVLLHYANISIEWPRQKFRVLGLDKVHATIVEYPALFICEIYITNGCAGDYRVQLIKNHGLFRCFHSFGRDTASWQTKKESPERYIEYWPQTIEKIKEISASSSSAS